MTQTTAPDSSDAGLPARHALAVDGAATPVGRAARLTATLSGRLDAANPHGDVRLAGGLGPSPSGLSRMASLGRAPSSLGRAPSLRGGAEPKPVDVTGAKGTVFTAAVAVLAAVASFPVLAMPWATATMGWPGLAVLAASGAATGTWGVGLMAGATEVGGQRYGTYREVAEAALGTWAWWLVTPLQMTMLTGTCIVLGLLAGQALKSLAIITTGSQLLPLAAWTWVWAAFQAPMVLLPDMHSSTTASLLGVLAFGIMAGVAGVASMVHGSRHDTPPRDYGTHAAGTPQLIQNVLLGLGTAVTAYGIGIAPEIQATLGGPHHARRMRLASVVAFVPIIASYVAVAAAGYWAFGSSVAPIVLTSLTSAGTSHAALGVAWAVGFANCLPIYQLYACPIYEVLDSWIQGWADKRGGGAARPSAPILAARLGARAGFVAATALAASALPFFGDAMAALGSFFLVLDFVIPTAAWAAVAKPQRGALVFAWAVAALYLAAGVAVLVAALASLVRNVGTYRLFADM